MSKDKNKKVLVTLDGSGYALNGVKYISKIPSFQYMEVVLLHVFNKVPDHYWDLERNASTAWKMNATQ